MKKLYQILFVCFFMVFISAPAIKHLTSKDKVASRENRKLNQRPPFPNELAQVKSYVQQLDNYFSDQFGYRKAFISGANKFKYKVFNEVLSPQITVGKDGFIFFNSHSSKMPKVMHKSVCGITKLPNSFLQKTKTNFKFIIDYFRKSGIKSQMVIVPTKPRIYPEKLPELEQSWCQQNPITWRDKLIAEIGTDYIYYPLEKMRSLKTTMSVYLPSFFHWHGELPKLIAEIMTDQIWGIKPLFETSAQPISIKSYLRLHLQGLDFYNPSFTYDYESQGVEYCKGIHCLPNIKYYYKNATIYTYKKPQNDLKLTLITDSFGKYIAPHFSRMFSEVIHIDINNLKSNEQPGLYDWIISDIKPSHLIYMIHDGGTFGHTTNLTEFMTSKLSSP